MGRVRLFAYGSLRPGEKPPRSMANPEPDEIHGKEIQQEHSTKAAEGIDIGSSPDMIKGWSMIVDNNELPELDKREAPDYKRVMVKTSKGYHAFAYQYQKK